jgi:hypothetical protein
MDAISYVNIYMSLFFYLTFTGNHGRINSLNPYSMPVAICVSFLKITFMKTTFLGDLRRSRSKSKKFETRIHTSEILHKGPWLYLYLHLQRFI